MTTETKADDFKVGDQVWCAMHGRGVVEHVCFDDMLSVEYLLIMEILIGTQKTVSTTLI